MQNKGIRQSMAWLHTWTGLIFGWLLFAIFLMGTSAYYRHHINLWMQPQLAQYRINQDVAVKTAVEYLNKNAADAKSWYVSLANQENPVNKMYWEKATGGYESKTLDANTGKELKLSNTQGGDFFYNFHFQLYGMPVLIGRLITSLTAFIMLIALISGIITHKKIITDFFTLRTFKSQRSWLDFHNVSSVLALPFFLTITFTGLAIFFYLYLPFGMKKLYPDNPFQYFTEIRTISVNNNHNADPIKTEMLPIQTLLEKVKQQLGDQALATIEVKNPNTDQATISFKQLEDRSITLNQPQITFDATGNILGNTKNNSAVATLNAGVYGLHMATFAQPLLRLAFFCSGILGCLMIASGLLLWSLKRQIQNKSNQFNLGHYLVDRLNIATFIGLPIAMLTYMFTNRFVQITETTPNYEIYSFFVVWTLSLIIALFTKKQYLWQSQVAILGIVAIALPIYDLIYLLNHQLVTNFQSYWAFLRVDLFFILSAGFALFVYRNIHPIQHKSAQKIKTKLAQTEARA
ncbi:PepSY-associated TM helix domain-containing protein [Acinetobacter venetianus]|uniref:PepSY-associated TM helix domain-containing protein n=1 Tax=Acinetobacter venetianus TaxID=52133 RepID=UPI001A10DE7C|nr:PepSY-associated TM helix domain-containing protein [Acinetobacter venetianus]HIQ33520.1 PepSY domain-containing protein [Acinetobacter venetianus]HJP49294.1 PepSY-associated TM helix domain-containing protein [Acinetobacter venetianus]